jgi:hypothetical protein
MTLASKLDKLPNRCQCPLGFSSAIRTTKHWISINNSRRLRSAGDVDLSERRRTSTVQGHM